MFTQKGTRAGLNLFSNLLGKFIIKFICNLLGMNFLVYTLLKNGYTTK